MSHAFNSSSLHIASATFRFAENGSVVGIVKSESGDPTNHHVCHLYHLLDNHHVELLLI
jgi:hypothetical protein